MGGAACGGIGIQMMMMLEVPLLIRKHGSGRIDELCQKQNCRAEAISHHRLKIRNGRCLGASEAEIFIDLLVRATHLQIDAKVQ